MARKAEDTRLGVEERAARAEEALREALEERNRLWEALQRKGAAEEDATWWRARAQRLEGSMWWRAGAPLRLLDAVLRDPGWALEAAGRRLQRLRGR
jgi:hypothetical protein